MTTTNTYVELTPHKKKICSLIEVLMNKYPANYLIPCSTKKSKGDKTQPLFAHKNNKYNWDFMKDPNNFVDFPKNGTCGIILKDLLVIDIDDKSYIPILEQQFKILTECVSEKTAKGKHYYFKRSKLCDELEIFTAIKCLKINGVVADIDIKTIHSTGTGSIIVCDPSPKKEWVHSITEKDIEIIPDELIYFMKANWVETNKPKIKEVKLSKEEKTTKIIEYVSDNKENFDATISIELLKVLVNILKDYKNNNYDDWIKVGWAIYNITNGSNEGLEIWDEFSKDSDKYIKGNCNNYWSNMVYNKNGYSEGSLRWWAKKSDKKAYDHFLELSIKNYILVSLRNNDLDIANVIYQLYKDEFKIFSAEDGKITNCWRFHNHRWRPKAINELKKKMITDVYSYYEKLANDYTQQMNDTNEEEEKKKLQLVSSAYTTIANSLLSSTRQRLIIDQLKILMHEDADAFHSKLNENPNLLGFENGVYDFSEGHFREGRPDDYLTFSTGYDYTEVIDSNIQAHIKDILWKSWENDNLYQYMMDLMSYAITGNKMLEIYGVLMGTGGRNGKSLICMLAKLTFGNYYEEIKPNNFTDPNDNKGGTDSEMVKLQGKRLVVASEPAKTAKLQMNRIKEATGGDLIKARGLYKDAITYICQFLILFLANHALVNSCYKDKANEKRLKVIPYDLEFVEEPTKPNERLIDTTIKTMLTNKEEYKQQFMLMIIANYYKIFNKEKKCFIIKTPDEVSKTTNKMLLSNNEFMLWFDDNYEIATTSNFIKKTDIFNDYKEDHHNFTKKSTFYKYMEENGFVISKIDGYEVYRGIKRIEESCLIVKGDM